MVKLRLRRVGRKKLALYKIVAADSRAPRDGRFIESVGTYNPNLNPAQVEVKEDRIFYWLKSGAQPTFTVRNLLSRKGILMKLNLIKRGFDAGKIDEEFSKWVSYQAVKLQNEQQKKLKGKEKKKSQLMRDETKAAVEAAAQPESEAKAPEAKETAEKEPEVKVETAPETEAKETAEKEPETKVETATEADETAEKEPEAKVETTPEAKDEEGASTTEAGQ